MWVSSYIFPVVHTHSVLDCHDGHREKSFGAPPILGLSHDLRGTIIALLFFKGCDVWFMNVHDCLFAFLTCQQLNYQDGFLRDIHRCQLVTVGVNRRTANWGVFLHPQTSEKMFQIDDPKSLGSV